MVDYSATDVSFGRLWAAFVVSQVGSGLALGAIPYIAIHVLSSTDAEVSLLSSTGAAAFVVLSLPIGAWIESRRKRDSLIVANLIRGVSTLGIPAAYYIGILSFHGLLIATCVSAIGNVIDGAANGAFLKSVLPKGERKDAYARIDSTMWLSTILGPSVGGSLVGLWGPTVTVLCDSMSYFVAALLLVSVWRDPVPLSEEKVSRSAWALEGGRAIWRDPRLLGLWANSAIYSAGIGASAPLISSLMLNDLSFSAREYGYALGMPAVGGLLGALLASRLPSGSPLLNFRGLGFLRTIWIFPIALIPKFSGALPLIISLDFFLLVFAGMFNPLLSSKRLDVTPDNVMSRVSVSWSLGSRVATVVATLLCGQVAWVLGTRVGIMCAGGLTFVSSLTLLRNSVGEPPAGRYEEVFG